MMNRVRHFAVLLWLVAAWGVLVGPLAGCAGENAALNPGAQRPPIDADPLALLPGGAVAVVSLDAKTFFASGALGAQVAAMTERLLPMGQEAGLVPSRDVDRLLFGIYAVGGVDATAVVSGRFDLARIASVADAHGAARGGPVVALPYGGRVIYTVSGLGFAPFSERTMLVGTEMGLRRALDRLGQGAPSREIAPWMVQTLETPGAAFGAAVDVASLPPGLFQTLPLPMTWTNGLSNVRLIGDFHDPGLNVAETLTYLDPPHATTGADSLRQLGTIVSAAGSLGVAPRLSNLSIVPNGANVECKFVLDEQGLKTALASLVQWLGASRPAPRAAPPPAAPHA